MLEIKIVDASTGKETVREMTEKELKEFEKAQLTAQEEQAAREEAQAARVAKLEALGLTPDDLRALLG